MKIFVMIYLLLIPFMGVSQNIQRKGSLGVGYYPVTPDSLIKKLSYKTGVVVKFIAPNSTAAALGLQTNDVITKINGTLIHTANELLDALKNLRENENINVSISRNGRDQNLIGKVLARPMESSTTASIRYGEFAYKKGWVRTIYKAPLNKKPLGTVYFLQGISCYSMDNFRELDITKQAIDAMVDRGFAVYRMEKGDMGDNTNIAPCATMGYDEELDMYMAGYKNLLTLKDVDTSTIFLFGHSLGGTVAPLVAEKFQPKGVLVYGTVFKPWVNYLLDANIIQSAYYGEDLATLTDQMEAVKPYIYDYFYSDKSIEEICATKPGLEAMKMVINYDPKTKLSLAGRTPQFHREISRHNLPKAWRNTNSFVLAMYGECDIAANNADDHIALVKYVNTVHPGKGTFYLMPKTTHTFEEIGTMEEFIKMQADPAAYQQYAATRFNPKVFDYSCNWMKEVLRK